jgi:hypothetical protein
MDKVDLKKKPPRKKKIAFFFQSSHQVDMKNVVECQREFFAYFNALETRGAYMWLTKGISSCVLCLLFA